MRGITHRERYFRPRADGATHAARVQHDVCTDGDTPFIRQCHQVRHVHAAGGVGRVEEEHHFACLAKVGTEQVHFTRHVVAGWPGDHEHRGVFGHGRVLRQRERSHLEVVALERFGNLAVAARVRTGRITFAVPLDEVHLLRFAFHHLDQGVGDLLLGVRVGAFAPPGVFKDDGAELRHFVPLRFDGLLLDVEKLHLQLRREVLILGEPVAESLHVGRAVKHPDRHRLGE